MHRRLRPIVMCIVALCCAARAQEAPPAAPAPAGLADLAWAPGADLGGISLFATAVGHAEGDKSGLEAAVAESHRRLLALVGLSPSPEAFGLFERVLVIDAERTLDDGGVEVRVSIPMDAFADIARQLRTTATGAAAAPAPGGTPLIPSLPLPVVVGPDGSTEILGPPVIVQDMTLLSTMASLNAQGLDLAARGNLREAVIAFRKASEVDPRSPLAAEPHANLAAIYFHENRLQDALEHYRLAAELNPTFPLARYGLGLTYRLVGQTPMAAMELMTFLQLEPTGSLAEAAKTILNQMGALPTPPPVEGGAIEVPPVVPGAGV